MFVTELAFSLLIILPDWFTSQRNIVLSVYWLVSYDRSFRMEHIGWKFVCGWVITASSCVKNKKIRSRYVSYHLIILTFQNFFESYGQLSYLICEPVFKFIFMQIVVFINENHHFGFNFRLLFEYCSSWPLSATVRLLSLSDSHS